MSLKDLLPGTNIKILNNLGTYDSGVVIEKAKSTCVSNLYYVKWRQDGTITLQQIYKRDVNEPRTNSSKNSKTKRRRTKSDRGGAKRQKVA
tara:strand:+ start:10521 stop:10793 length:273 start_codon:yes stop_codon:yes gene_type:complete